MGGEHAKISENVRKDSNPKEMNEYEQKNNWGKTLNSNNMKNAWKHVYWINMNYA